MTRYQKEKKIPQKRENVKTIVLVSTMMVGKATKKIEKKFPSGRLLEVLDFAWDLNLLRTCSYVIQKYKFSVT